MSSTDYTSKEFSQKYDVDFFKRIDRFTSNSSDRPDFYSFYGIDRRLIQNENNKQYQIPVEVADILAGMIRAFTFAYGNDKRGQKKRGKQGNCQGREDTTPISYSYSKYHQYIESLRNEISNMQPFQQALIKDHDSYYNALIIDEFLPRFVERIVMLVISLHCYKNDTSSDFLIAAVEYLDKMIDQFFQRREQIFSAQKSDVNKIYTFEDAISDTFNLLANPNYNCYKAHIYEKGLLEKIIAKKLELEKETNVEDDIKSRREHIISELNNVYFEYIGTHQDTIALRDYNLQKEINTSDSFWKLESSTARSYLWFSLNYTKELSELLKTVESLSLTSFTIDSVRNALKEKAKEAIMIEDWSAINAIYHALNYAKLYEVELARYLNLRPMNDASFKKFFDQCIAEHDEEIFEASEFQNKVHQDKYRSAICAYYSQIRNSDIFNSMYQSIMDSMAQILPSRLK